MRLTPEHRIALLMHEGTQSPRGKTGLAMLRYSQFPVVAVIDHDCAGQSLAAVAGIAKQIPIVASVEDALAFGPDVLAIGIAPSGGALPAPWLQEVKQAINAGLCVVNGLHTPMAQDLEMTRTLNPGQWIWDVRQEPPSLQVGSALAQTLQCRRVLTVGTDMSVGKMSTNLELHRASLKRGLRSKVIATGQTNLMLGDDGIPLDAVRVDFASGAVEQQVMRYGPDHDILYIEGQGSLLNPASTATLPLLRGAQPTHLILVHRAGQTHIRNCPQIPVPPLPKVIHLYETVATAAGAFSFTKVVGIALNTGDLDQGEAAIAIQSTQAATGLPCTDVFRFGPTPLLEAILA
ncbi:hypothetical protein XM38_052710 [Halomicronema hongdechloris C2206]|uniref:DUF1611 domain-containing protein n=1 Tax=Halomicronema hongdechloris C2206 TaxID=1641165 RepID=A0A1Z3HVK0_9CYAN|nr:DUF1611 domain-containing protein [Halomicronema hongdechloris]ASC74296.1 hypothetical protein XM38_052710 [Halomicronema hongdechloris C2206]